MRRTLLAALLAGALPAATRPGSSVTVTGEHGAALPPVGELLTSREARVP